MSAAPDYASVLRTASRVLFFQATREELVALHARHLAIGLVFTWLVGMGRYWDDPEAHVLQHLGIGSIVYVFVLSALLWAVMKPIGAKDWTYQRVLTLVTLTSPPALLYAIPVERFMELTAARTANVWFLAAVAVWRVLLLVFFARRLGTLNWFSVVVGTSLPLTFVISALTALNLERSVFDVMGGLRGDGTANDAAYSILILLTVGSVMAFVPLAIGWIALVVLARDRRRTPTA